MTGGLSRAVATLLIGVAGAAIECASEFAGGAVPTWGMADPAARPTGDQARREARRAVLVRNVERLQAELDRADTPTTMPRQVDIGTRDPHARPRTGPGLSASRIGLAALSLAVRRDLLARP
ncbi:hypothetical protein [Actinokineospora enzanensis]|uniref:hypothetical protein n=1 Tax=Actinokineospora enzanensis TaxID=155975 RepID=UPI000360529A|nr:hypothetical protein [Actinokineospora enzanensis]